MAGSGGKIFRFSLSTILLAVTAYCVGWGYWTTKRYSELYSPPPTAAYSPDIEPYQFSDADFVYPLDLRPARVRLDYYVEAIESRIETLRDRGEERAAEEMQYKLEAVLSRDLSLPYPAPNGSERMHAVGFYEGDEHKNGDATVRVTDTSGPLTLVLASCEAINWSIELAPAVQVTRVIVGGHEVNSVSGLDSTVPIEGSVDGQANPQFRFYAHHRISDWVGACRVLKNVTGLELTTWQGAYRPEGEYIEIGPRNADWSVQMRAAMLLPLYREATREQVHALASALTEIAFPMVHFGSVNRYGDGPAAFAMASIFGPYTETMQPLEARVDQLVYLPHGPSFLAMRGSELVSIDPGTGRFMKMDVPGLERGGQLALDTDNNRLYVVTVHGSDPVGW